MKLKNLFSDEFKAKAKLRLRKLGDAVVPFLIGGTIGAAWVGYGGALKNHADIVKVKKDVRTLTEVVDHNASAGNALVRRVQDIERQNNLLMEKALSVTEGKESA